MVGKQTSERLETMVKSAPNNTNAINGDVGGGAERL